MGLLLGLLFLIIFPGAERALAIDHYKFIPPVLDQPRKGTRALVDANVFTYDTDSKIATASGAVHVKYGPYTLDAEHVWVNEKTGEFRADGAITMTEPNGNVVEADSADMRNHFRDGIMNHIRILLTNHATIAADRLRRVDGSVFVYERAHYSACAECRNRYGDPIWEIVAKEVVHDTRTHDLYYTDPRFHIGGATVLGLPYLAMPDPSVTRRSGFLAPELNFQSVYGAGLTTPYFWAISPSTDLTFRPIWTTEQGPVADVEWRQALENGSYSIRGIGVHQFTAKPYPDDQDWRGALETKGRFRSGDWSYGWDGTFASDRTFLKDYGLDDRVYAVNDIYATRIADQDYFSAQFLNFQSLSTDIDQSSLPYAMPFIAGEKIMRDIPIGGQLDFSWNAYSLHRDESQVLFNGLSSTTEPVTQGTDQTRATAQVNWHQQFYGAAGTVITPFANLRGDMLITNNVPDPSNTADKLSETMARVLPEIGVDARYPFVADTAFGQSVISPVFQIVSSADEGDTSAFGNEDAISVNYDHTSMFLADRFSGSDRYEGGTHADIGITYSLFGRNGGFIRASAGQSFHIAGQNSFVEGSGLSDNESDLVGAIVVQPWNELSLSYEARVKDDFSGINRQEAVASLSFDRITTSVSYLDFEAAPAYGLTTPLHGVSGDAKIALNNGWSIFGGMTYDLQNSIFTRKVAGFEYDCRCMNVKLYYSGLEDSVLQTVDNRVILSVEFATLGTTGARVGF